MPPSLSSKPFPFYPGAIWRPLLGHSEAGTIEQRNTIVPHITEGPTAAGAISTFEKSVRPNRVSAHFVIDRDGTVYQLLPLANTAWHASQANYYSIGIEHAAISAVGAAALNSQAKQLGIKLSTPFVYMPVTDVQYEASAKLLKWLCGVLKIPVDRNHIRTHNEVSPRDGHVLCCTGALDPDKLVNLAKGLV